MEKIDKVLKYNHNGEDIWIYSVEDFDENNNVLYKYYTLFLKDNEPVIVDLVNPIETLQNINIQPTIVKEDSIDYLIFLTYKDVAFKNIINKIKK